MNKVFILMINDEPEVFDSIKGVVRYLRDLGVEEKTIKELVPEDKDDNRKAVVSWGDHFFTLYPNYQVM